MAIKRRESSSVASGAGDAKRQRTLAKQCGSIQNTLLSAENIPVEVLDMLGGNLQHCLGVPKEDRHAYQEKVVKMVGEVLGGIESATQKNIEVAQEKLNNAGAEKDVRDKAHQVAAEAVTRKAQAVEVAKIAVGESESAEKAAKTAVSAAEKAKVQGDAALDDASAKKEKLDKLRNECFLPLKNEGEVAKDAKKKAITALVKFGKEHDLDQSMMTSLPSAMEKPAGERTTFDGMVVDQLEAEISKRIQDLQDTLAAGEPGKAERAGIVESAQAKYAAAMQEAEARKAAFDQSKTQFAAAKDEHKAAAKAASHFWPEMKQVEKDLEARKAEMAAFTEGAMAAYKELLHPPAPAADA